MQRNSGSISTLSPLPSGDTGLMTRECSPTKTTCPWARLWSETPTAPALRPCTASAPYVAMATVGDHFCCYGDFFFLSWMAKHALRFLRFFSFFFLLPFRFFLFCFQHSIAVLPLSSARSTSSTSPVSAVDVWGWQAALSPQANTFNELISFCTSPLITGFDRVLFFFQPHIFPCALILTPSITVGVHHEPVIQCWNGGTLHKDALTFPSFHFAVSQKVSDTPCCSRGIGWGHSDSGGWTTKLHGFDTFSVKVDFIY